MSELEEKELIEHYNRQDFDELVGMCLVRDKAIEIKGKEIERLNNIIEKLERLIDDYSWNSYYYKCNGRYLKSEILNDIREIIDKDSDKE